MGGTARGEIVDAVSHYCANYFGLRAPGAHCKRTERDAIRARPDTLKGMIIRRNLIGLSYNGIIIEYHHQRIYKGLSFMQCI